MLAQLAGEVLDIEAELLRVADEIGWLECVLVVEQQVVHLPERALFGGCLGCLGSELGLGMDIAQRQVAPDVAELGAKLVDEFLVFRVCECFQWRRVPGPAPVFQQPADFFTSYPRLATSRWRGDQHVFIFECCKRFDLKRVGLERSSRRCTDSFEKSFDLSGMGNNARGSFVCDVVTGFAVRFLVLTTAARFAFVPVFSAVSGHEVHSNFAFVAVLTRTLRVTMASKSGLTGQN